MTYTNLIFLLGILPLTVITSLFDRSAEYKNLILIITSVLFITWGQSYVVLALLLSCILDYGFGLCCGRLRGNSKLGAGVCLALDLIMNAGICIVLTRNYMFDGIDRLAISKAVIPVGVAFYTIRAFSYVYDVYKGKISAEKNIFCLLTYLISFHLCVVGPIVRYGDIEPQIRKREITGEKLNNGLNNLIYGLGKVVLIGYTLGKLRMSGLNGGDVTFFGCWLGMAAFFGEIYFYFSGLTQMAKGIGLLSGFEYKDNFAPVSSKGLFTGLVKGFNTSLVELAQEVVVSPFKNRKVLSCIAIIGCSAGVAMWYSFGWRFLIAGLLVGGVIVAEKLVLKKKFESVPTAVKYIYMIILSMVIFGLLYFKSFYGYRKWILGLVGVGDKYAISVQMKNIIMNNLFVLLVGIAVYIPFLKNGIVKCVSKLENKSSQMYGMVQTVKIILRVCMLLMCLTALVVRSQG